MRASPDNRSPVARRILQHHQRGDQPVARRGVIQENDVTGLLATQDGPALLHFLQHITVADSGAHQADPLPGHAALQAQVAHHRADQHTTRQASLRVQVAGGNGQYVVAVHHPSGLIRQHQPIGVTVEGKTQVRAVVNNRLRHHLGMGGAAAGVDVAAVRLAIQRDHVRAQLAEERRRKGRDRPVRTIDH